MAPDLLGYELGDAVILVGDERFRGSELLFQPHLIGMEAGRGVAFFSEELRVLQMVSSFSGFEYVTGMVLNFWFRTMAAWWICTRIQYTLRTCVCFPLMCIEYTWVYDSPCISQTYSLALAATVRRCCWNPMEVCDDGGCRHSPYFDAPWPSNLWQKRLSLFWRSMVPSARQNHILARKLSDDFLNGAVEQTKCFRDGTPCITLRHSLNWWNFISC